MPASSPRSKPAPFEVRESPIAGLGVFATRRIRAGTRLIEYVGERIDSEEAGRRYDDDAMEQHHTFLFGLDDDTLLDGGVGGNESRYFNHACVPNCEAVIEDGRIFIDTLEDIEPGTELVYDYALVREEPWQAHWAQLYACRCGVPRCRGLILSSPKPPKKKATTKEKKKPTRAERPAAKASRGRSTPSVRAKQARTPKLPTTKA